MSQSPNNSAASRLCRGEDAGYVVSHDWISDTLLSSSLPSHFSPSSDDRAVVELFESEAYHMPHADYLRRCSNRSIDVTARQDSINWILMVHSFYLFKPITALLSVNYLDRFLSSNSLPLFSRNVATKWVAVPAFISGVLIPCGENGGAGGPSPRRPSNFRTQTCFRAEIVQRMELWVVANLHWRLRSITPYDFLQSFISKLPSSCSASNGDLFAKIFLASSHLILGTNRAIDFLGCLPSTIAAAAVICVAGKSVDFTSDGCNFPASFHERLNKEMGNDEKLSPNDGRVSNLVQ